MGHFKVFFLVFALITLNGIFGLVARPPRVEDLAQSDNLIQNTDDQLNRRDDELFALQLKSKITESVSLLNNLDGKLTILQNGSYKWDALLQTLLQKVSELDHKVSAMTESKLIKEIQFLESMRCKDYSYLVRERTAMIVKKLAKLEESIEAFKHYRSKSSGEWLAPCIDKNIDDLINKVDYVFNHLKDESYIIDAAENDNDSMIEEGMKKAMRKIFRRNMDKQELRMPLRGRRFRSLNEVEDRLEEIKRSLKTLGRYQQRNVNENERILRRLERKVNDLLDDDDKLASIFKKSLKKLEQRLVKAIDSDDDDSSDDDSNDDDDSDSNEDDSNEKGGNRKRNRKNDDDDDDDSSDSDENDSNEKGGNRKRNGKDKSDDDDDDDSSDSNEKGGNRKRSGKDNSDDDDDDDSSDSNEKGGNRKRNGKDNSDDDDDDDSSDSNEKGGNRKRNGKDNSDDDDNDDSSDSNENDSNEKGGNRKRNRKNDNDDDSDSSDNNDDSKEDNSNEQVRKKDSRIRTNFESKSTVANSNNGNINNDDFIVPVSA